MNLVSGINHVAIITSDLERFIRFYDAVFGAEVAFHEVTPAFRHAILRTGPSSWLHPVEVTGNPHGAAVPEMFARGHIDHVALSSPSQEAFDAVRARLLDRGATSGVVEDLGAFHALWFTDPDGMRGELSLIVDPALRVFHAPVPLPGYSSGYSSE
jgi:catechol 2,3-dioxygenase-like lactoylglutathione lyase family enzyme